MAELKDLCGIGVDGVVVWKAPAAPKPEPCARLTYGDRTYLIPYTLMTWLTGWVLMGGKDTFAPLDALENTKAALKTIEIQMAADCSTITQEQVDFYERHNIPTGPVFPAVKDYGPI